MTVKTWLDKRSLQALKKTQGVHTSHVLDIWREIRTELGPEAINSLRYVLFKLRPALALEDVSVDDLIKASQNKLQLRQIMQQLPSKTHQELFKSEYRAFICNTRNILFNVSNKDFEAMKLDKAVDPKDLARVTKRINHDAKNVVDATAHLQQFPAAPEYKQIHSSQKKFKQVKDIANGISAKMVHSVAHSGVPGDDTKYMTKPYHKNIESATKSWVKHPILGWATMATKALFDAGKIGHLCEDVAAHDVNGEAMTVHKFQPNMQDVSKFHWNNRDRGHNKTIDPLHVQQIGVMDYLANNLDRHSGNLMVSDHTTDDGVNPLLAIDHERNFQYHKGLKDTWRSKLNSSDHIKETPYDYIRETALTGPMQAAHFVGHDELSDWWHEHGQNIKAAFTDQSQHIKDDGIRRHVSNNFNDRWNAMDQWAKGHKNNEFSDDRKSLSIDFPHVRTQPMKQPVMPKSRLKDIVNTMAPKEAVGILTDLVNKRDKLTDAQCHLVQDSMQKVVNKATPEQLSDLLRHAIDNPHMNTKKLKSKYSQLLPQNVILNHLLQIDPQVGRKHMNAVADMISNLPPEKKEVLGYFGDRLRRLAQTQENR